MRHGEAVVDRHGASPPRSAGSPGGSTRRPRGGTARSWPRSACRPATRPAVAGAAGGDGAWTRRPAPRGCGSSCWTAWPARHPGRPARGTARAGLRGGELAVPGDPAAPCWCSTARTWAGSAPASPRSTAPPRWPTSPPPARPPRAKLGLSVDVRQTDDEAELIGWVHEAADRGCPSCINPAAFTHYSYALRDALAMRTAPAGRGAPVQPGGPRDRSGTPRSSPASPTAPSPGFGLDSYELALRAVAALAGQGLGPGEPVPVTIQPSEVTGPPGLPPLRSRRWRKASLHAHRNGI